MLECGNDISCYASHQYLIDSSEDYASSGVFAKAMGSFYGLSEKTTSETMDFIERENLKSEQAMPNSVKAGKLVLGAVSAGGIAGGYQGLNWAKSKFNSNSKLPGSIAGYSTEKINIQGEVVISKSKYPESALHIQNAIKQGKPDVLTIDRSGANQRRREALKNYPTKYGFDRDEYPPAMFLEGGRGASIKYISPKDNRGAGSCIGHQCNKLNDGDKIKIRIGD